MYKLTIENYQIIKKTDITFRPGLTLITGKSNNGKSSIFKAFKQLVYNTSGKDYIRWGAKETKLKLEQPNGSNIEYRKSAKESSYKIQTSEGEKNLSKLGASQVQEIKDITQMDRDLDFNFWNQLEKPFLLNSSPKETFDILQTSPYTEVLYDTQQDIIADRKAESTKIIQTQAQIDLLQEQLKTLEKSKELLPVFEKEITSRMSSLSMKDKQNQKIKLLLESFENINLEINVLTQKEAKYSKLEIESIKENLLDKLSIKKHLENIDLKLNNYIALSLDVSTKEKLIPIYTEFNFEEILRNLQSKYMVHLKSTESSEKNRTLENLIISINEYESKLKIYEDSNLINIFKEIVDKKESLLKFQTAYQNLVTTVPPVNELVKKETDVQTKIDKIKAFKATNFNVCPLCQQKIA